MTWQEPLLQMSQREQGGPEPTSGAMYMGLPQRVAAMTPSWRKRANPKSATFSVTSRVDGFGRPVGLWIRMFCGCTFPSFVTWGSWEGELHGTLRSLWTIPLAFMAAMAAAICFAKRRIVSSERVP